MREEFVSFFVIGVVGDISAVFSGSAGGKDWRDNQADWGGLLGFEQVGRDPIKSSTMSRGVNGEGVSRVQKNLSINGIKAGLFLAPVGLDRLMILDDPELHFQYQTDQLTHQRRKMKQTIQMNRSKIGKRIDLFFPLKHN